MDPQEVKPKIEKETGKPVAIVYPQKADMQQQQQQQQRRQHQCLTCQKTFTARSSLIRHQKTCGSGGGDSGSEMQKCPTCQKSFGRLDSLRRHEKTHGIVALCSKTYYCFGQDKGDKSATKGLDKRQNELSKERFLNVLRTGTPGGGTNTTFRTDGVSMYTYKQQRNSLSYFYIKRKVLADGVSTAPLSV